jgi:anti-anti-sigma factor
MGVNFNDEFLESGLRKVSLSGTLDAPGAMAVEQQFQDKVIAQGGHVIVDLSGVEYMSSYGLRMFLVTAKGLMEKGGGLHLAGAPAHVMEVIRMAGYDTMFPVYDSLEDAIIQLSG